MKIVIPRGIPGAGKSTYTQELAKNMKVAVCSADHFFTRDGVYKYNPNLIGVAHAECLKKFTELCRNPGDIECVVVDNTNTRVREVRAYLELAKSFGHEVEIVTLRVDPEVAHRRNVHSVPIETIKRMHNTLVESENHFDPSWNHTIIQK